MSINSSIQSLYWIDTDDDETPFPPVDLALPEPDGLLAFGGNLSSKRLLNGYRHGIFPWYSQGQPIMWWSPDPRSIILPAEVKISRSLRKTLKKKTFTITFDKAFNDVIEACSQPRKEDGSTWITAAMKAAYCRLHTEGHAHSVEAWNGDELVGGLYGIDMGRIFFGESMFSLRSDASKYAFVTLLRHLGKWGYKLLDCQVQSDHLDSLGAKNIARKDFIHLLDQWCDIPGQRGNWSLDSDVMEI